MSEPTWDEAVLLMRQTKPPVRAVILVEHDDGTSDQVRAMTDGRGGWLIESEERLEVTFPSSTMSAAAGVLEMHLRPVIYAGYFGHVKSLIDPTLLSLEHATGSPLGTRVVAGRRGFQFRVSGLKRGTPLRFDLVIDEDTGVILRLDRVIEEDESSRNQSTVLSFDSGVSIEPPDL